MFNLTCVNPPQGVKPNSDYNLTEGKVYRADDGDITSCEDEFFVWVTDDLLHSRRVRLSRFTHDIPDSVLNTRRIYGGG